MAPPSARSSLVSRASLISVVSECDEADGEWLFSQLLRICTDDEVSREDYYSEEEGWDFNGLRSDLQLYMTTPTEIN